MNNISTVSDCYGCGVCATACAKNIIDIVLNAEGFYEPRIKDDSLCVNCGICRDVCAYIHEDLSVKNQIIKTYAGWSKDEQVRRKCSSGGVGFEVGKTLLNDGYKVCGVRYNPVNKRAEHYIAANLTELIQSTGSKYIQSYTLDGFKSINKKERYLVTGTPCQIDSFRRYIQKYHVEDNFVLLDFFCHGVPTMHLWVKYCGWAEAKVGKIVYASWRNKFEYGWHDSWLMGVDGANNSKPIDWHDSYNIQIREKKTSIQSRMSQGDMFYTLFLSDSCLGKQCYEKCKYKYDKSAADIRIGDLWGNTYKDNKEGVCAVVVFTDKGDTILKSSNCEFVEHPMDVIGEGQMKTCPIISKQYTKVISLLKDDSKTIEDACRVIWRDKEIHRMLVRVKHPFSSLKNLIKRYTK